jgi:hypothetical protein
LNQVRFSTAPFHSIAHFMRQMGDVAITDIPQLHAFELLAEALARIQLWGIGGQVLQMEALRGAARYYMLPHSRAHDLGFQVVVHP